MITQEIWHYAKDRNIWLSSAHIPGKLNVVADAESRTFDTELEWQFNPSTFQSLQHISPLTCTLDLFASRLNTQLDSYVSYRPDPGAFAVDAFTLNFKILCLSTICPPSKSVAKDQPGSGYRGVVDPILAFSSFLLICFTYADCTSYFYTQECTSTKTSSSARKETQPSQKVEPSGMSYIRKSISASSISKSAQDLIIQSWRGKTQAQYSTYLNKWADFCSKRNENPLCAPVAVCLDYLVSLYEDGLSYSTINTARSAISTLHMDCGNSALVNRFMKGIFNVRPSLPRYTCTYDVKIVLDYLASLHLQTLSLRDLFMKLVLLLLFLSGQRLQIVQAFNVNDIQLNDDSCTFYIRKLLQTSKAGSHKSVFQRYDNRDLCVLQHLKQYLSLTEGLRGEETQLLISAVKPHKPVTIDTVSRWAKCSGVNIKTFTTHSTRAAATSKSYSIGVPLQDILSAASWSNAKTFAQFYNKPILEKSDTFGKQLLQNIYSHRCL